MAEDTKLKFEEHYFRGKQISNYEDYTKRKYDRLCEDLIAYCEMVRTDSLFDFGCATGALVKEFKERGFKWARGTDPSYWAITYGKENLGLKEELWYFNINALTEPNEWVLMLDVLEHVPTIEEIEHLLKMTFASRGLIVRIPISLAEGSHYYYEVSRNDKTHVQVHCRDWWQMMFEKCGWKIHEDLHLGTIFSSKGVMAVWLKRTMKSGEGNGGMATVEEKHHCRVCGAEVNEVGLCRAYGILHGVTPHTDPDFLKGFLSRPLSPLI